MVKNAIFGALLLSMGFSLKAESLKSKKLKSEICTNLNKEENVKESACEKATFEIVEGSKTFKNYGDGPKIILMSVKVSLAEQEYVVQLKAKVTLDDAGNTKVKGLAYNKILAISYSDLFKLKDSRPSDENVFEIDYDKDFKSIPDAIFDWVADQYELADWGIEDQYEYYFVFDSKDKNKLLGFYAKYWFENYDEQGPEEDNIKGMFYVWFDTRGEMIKYNIETWGYWE